MFNQKLFFLLAVYISGIFASNLLGMKTMPFLFGTHLSIAVFFLPFCFITTDIVGAMYGKDVSQKFVLAGTVALAFFLFANTLANMLPWSEATFSRIGEAYEEIFALSLRMGIASLSAFFISEYVDVIVFFAARKITSNFFFGSTFSNILSQGVDTVIFMSIAFLGVFPIEKIIMMALPWWIYKVLGGLAYSPIAYFILSYFQKKGSSHP